MNPTYLEISSRLLILDALEQWVAVLNRSRHMSNDNVFPLHPKPAMASDDTINGPYWHLAEQITREHAENLLADPALGVRLDRASGLNPETLLGNQPIPDQQLEQVGMESYIDCNGKRCYRPMGQGENQRRLNRIRDDIKYRAHVEAVYREVTERRLTEIDPDWRDHLKTLEAAEQFYRLELQKVGDTVDCGPFEPRDRT